MSAAKASLGGKAVLRNGKSRAFVKDEYEAATSRLIPAALISGERRTETFSPPRNLLESCAT